MHSKPTSTRSITCRSSPSSKSEAGLQSVTLDILTADNERVPVKTVTEFFNRKSYSLSEKVNWEADYSEAVITAVDPAGPHGHRVDPRIDHRRRSSSRDRLHS